MHEVAGAAALTKLGAWAAILGGGLRIASSFVPWRAEDAGLEAFYGLIDCSLMFGLIGVYLQVAADVGKAGLGCFAVALIGQASIVGPDAVAFGIDFYRLGALVFLVGLAGLAIQLVRARLLRLSAGLWIATLAASLGGAAINGAAGALLLAGAGVLVGAGFVAAGALMRRA